MNYQNLVRKNIQPLVPYSNTRSLYQGKIFLDDMESPYWGRYSFDVSDVALNRYPDGLFLNLRKKIAQYIGNALTEKNIVLGNGSDELISLLFQIFLNEDENVIITPPTFTMYKFLGQVRNCEVKEVPLLPETFQLDVEEILNSVNEKTKIIFLCNPNNPTGTLIKRADIEKIINKTNCIVVIDEAYGEYFPQGYPSFTKEIKEHKNIIVMRTFSKAWGLAGIRCGYALADEWIITEFDKIRLPFNIDRLAASILDQVLDQEAIMRSSVDALGKERAYIEQQFQSLGLKTFPTITNFVCAQLPTTVTSKEIMESLAEKQGILIRDRNKETHLANSIRVSVENTREKNDVFLNTLKELLS